MPQHSGKKGTPAPIQEVEGDALSRIDSLRTAAGPRPGSAVRRGRSDVRFEASRVLRAGPTATNGGRPRGGRKATAGRPLPRADIVTDGAESTNRGGWPRMRFTPPWRGSWPEPHHLTVNRIAFDPRGTAWVLTGPNRGGKTTHLRATGVVQVLGRCGPPVPDRSACIRLVRCVFTHFPARWRGTGQVPPGRMDRSGTRDRPQPPRGSVERLFPMTPAGPTVGGGLDSRPHDGEGAIACVW